MKRLIKCLPIIFFTCVTLTWACKKDDYYVDGGLAQQSKEEMNMSTYDFLKSRSGHPFDSLLKIVDLTNTQNIINQQNITFFAVPNAGIIRFQSRYNPDDRQTPRPLSLIGLDTLKMLLNRFVLPGEKIKLEGVTNVDYFIAYKDNNNDSLLINWITGLVNSSGTQVRNGPDRLKYEHRKIPGIDTTDFTAFVEIHNLQTANAVVHILPNSSNFAAGFKTKYIR